MVRTSGGSLSSVCLLSARAHARLVLREIRVGFDFENLLGMPLTVRRNEQHDLISVELAHGAVAHVVGQRGFRGSASVSLPPNRSGWWGPGAPAPLTCWCGLERWREPRRPFSPRPGRDPRPGPS